MPLIISKYTFRLCNLCVFYLVYLFLGYRGRACERPLTTTFDGYWCNCCFCKIILWVFLDQIKVRRLPWDVDCYSHIILKAKFFLFRMKTEKNIQLYLKRAICKRWYVQFYKFYRGHIIMFWFSLVRKTKYLWLFLISFQI